MKDNNIYMLSVLWFKPDGGEERYRQYMKLAMPLLEPVGGRKLKSFQPERVIIGECDADMMYFIEYPSWQAFKDYANSPDHHKIAYIRNEALEKSLLIRCVRPEKSLAS